MGRNNPSDGRITSFAAPAVLALLSLICAGCTPIVPSEDEESRLERPAAESIMRAALLTTPGVTAVEQVAPSPAYEILPPRRQIEQPDDYYFRVLGLDRATGYLHQWESWGRAYVHASLRWPHRAEPSPADRRRAVEVLKALVTSVRDMTRAGGYADVKAPRC